MKQVRKNGDFPRFFAKLFQIFPVRVIADHFYTDKKKIRMK